ncbi:mannonate dehydratase [Ruegeria profundi]|uniref:mannonate dehydratase n=1 Tax=Ruegeria profundi TaxID=1685378 RepID=UPI001CD3D7CA|nr:mannonate dehydratase [Ruegeria profundi]MCA0928419.1 mannonate dehydratase [Ruegeria profundi]
MQETWRWFGPQDQVSLSDVTQAGASGIVTALHHIPPGVIWPLSEITERRDYIAENSVRSQRPLKWSVVESLPVSEDIKRQTGSWREHVEHYKTSLENIALAGIEVICYNFMPLLDWTRTDLSHEVDTGATCMRFDLVDFIMFDVFILKRHGASEGHDDELVTEAHHRFQSTNETYKKRLVDNIVCGLPGAAEHFSLDDIKEQLAIYAAFDHDQLARNQTDFLEEVAPVAQTLGLRLCCHPDDPPVPLLGLPRIMSTEADYERLIEAVDIPANGITLCSGSLGARSDNDLPGMMDRLGDRVHFLHLRNVRREHDGVFGSFHESEHLSGDVDMPSLVAAILREENRRKSAGRADHSIPFRPDHGQDILDDLTRKAQPGYPAIGRLKGLAELRGLIDGLSYESGR